MKILFLTDNFPPEVNAPATRTFEHCRVWAREGHEVHVITCAPNFPRGKVFEGYRNRLYQREIVQGITVHRVWSFIWPNKGRVLRIVDYLSFALSSFIAGLFIKADVIIATSPQFFTAVSGGALGFVKGTPWVFEVRDLWPESIAAVGAMRRSFVLSLLEKLELRLYRSAAAVVVLTEGFRENLIGRGVPDEKISVVTNGVNREEWRCSDLAERERVREKLGVSGKFVLGYAGTMGMAHALDFIISAARKLNEVLSDVAIVLIGDGAERERLERRAAEVGLPNLMILPPVSKAELKPIMSAFDVSLVNLRRSETFKTVLPSKIFESSAMGKPILLGVDGEARALVERYGAGVFFEPEDEGEFIEKVRLLKEDSETYARCVRGGEVLASAYSRDGLARAMIEWIAGRVIPQELPVASDVVH